MPSYHVFTSSRTTTPDLIALVAAVRAALSDPTAVLGGPGPSYTGKKATPWSAGDIAAAQTALDTAPDLTPQRQAQNQIDQWPLAQKAFALAVIDQLNVLRAFHALPAITPAQALAAIRAKAGTL